METCEKFEEWWLSTTGRFCDTKTLCWEAWEVAIKSMGDMLKELHAMIKKEPVNTEKVKQFLSELPNLQRKEIFDFLREDYCADCGAYTGCDCPGCHCKCNAMTFTKVREQIKLAEEHLETFKKLQEYYEGVHATQR